MKTKTKKPIPAGVKHIAVYFLLFTVLVVSLYLMMVLFATIPNHTIRENMTRSARQELTADRYEIPENGSFRQIEDHYADQIWLNIAWQMGYGDPFVSVLDTGYYDGEGFGSAAGLHRAVTRGEPANKSYTRYWHASASCLRFLHLWTDIQGIKTVGLLCLLLFIFMTLRRLFRDGHGDLGMCLLASLLAIQIWQTRLSFEYLPCFLVCFGLCPSFLKLEKRGDTPLALLCVAAGTLVAFFDFLTAETVTVLVPLILVVAARSMDGRLVSRKDTARLLLRCLMCWGFAYVGAYAVKWIAVAGIAGNSHISTALASVGERMDGSVLINGVRKKPGFLRSIGANLSVLFGGSDRSSYGMILFGLLLCAAAMFLLVYEYRTRKNISRGTGFILTLGGFVFLRFSVLANHSYLHAFFTYRALLCPILAVLTTAMLNLRPKKKKRRRL